MPMLDKPLRELEQYRGINPRPADFDAYWARALDEMHALGTDCTLAPAEFQVPGVARCSELTFTGVDGAQVHARFMQPLMFSGKRPAVLMFHGYKGKADSWRSMLAFAGAGFAVAAMDARGQGGASEDAAVAGQSTIYGQIVRGLDGEPEDLFFRSVFLDTAQLARIVMAMDCVDENRMGATGFSQGGALTLACGALEPRVCALASLGPFLSDYERVWEMDLDLDAYQELRDYFRHCDPLHRRHREVFERLGYIDVQHLAPRIQGRTLMGTGLLDNICPPSTQFAAYNHMNCEKEHLVFPDYRHEAPREWDEAALLWLLRM